MAVHPLVCKQCGGQIHIEDGKELGFCKHCGTKVAVKDDVIQNVTINQYYGTATEPKPQKPPRPQKKPLTPEQLKLIHKWTSIVAFILAAIMLAVVTSLTIVRAADMPKRREAQYQQQNTYREAQYRQQNTYTVSLSSGGTVDVVYNRSFTIAPPSIPTGHYFMGWYSQANGQGTQYTSADGNGIGVWNVQGNTNVYAYFISLNFTVTYNYESGTGADLNKVVSYGSNYQLVVPTRTDYDFMGWFAQPNGKGTKYTGSSGQSSAVWNLQQDIDVFAHWMPKGYVLTYHNNFSPNQTTTQVAIYGTAGSMSGLGTFTRTGYTLLRWNTESNGSGTNYAFNYSFDSTEIVSNMNLYAVWQANTYKVSFSGNGGANTQTWVTATYDSAMPTITNKPTLDDHRFLGFFDAISGGSKYYNDDLTSARTWNKAEDTTLYAHWEIGFSGAGTEHNPYIVKTALGLTGLATNVNNGQSYAEIHFKLNTSFDLGGVEWTPIGISPANSFSGIFNGDNKTISNFKITEARSGIGFFGYNYGTIENLNLENFTINVNSISSVKTSMVGGGLVAFNYSSGLIDNCYSAGNITVRPGWLSNNTSATYAGGLVGRNLGTITNSYSASTVNAIASYTDFSVGTTSYQAYAGCLAATNSGTITNSCASGNVTATRTTGNTGLARAGGLVGSISTGSVIERCFATGSVSATVGLNATASAGGLIGYAARGGGATSGTTRNSYATGNVTAQGSSSSSTVSDPSNIYIGGLFGYTEGSSTIIQNCFATGDITVTGTTASSPLNPRAGGLIGYLDGNVQNAFATGNVSTSVSNGSRGGFFGTSFGGSGLTRCYRYEGQVVDSPTNTSGTEVSVEQLDNANFYTSSTTLGWSSSIWNSSQLDFLDGKFPILEWEIEKGFHSIMLTRSNTEAGAVTGSGRFQAGKQTTITAATNNAYTWVGWYEGNTLLSTSTSYAFTMPNANVVYEARWSNYLLELRRNNTAAGTISGAGTFVVDAERTITATTYTGYIWLGWYEGDTLISTLQSYTFAMPMKNVIYEARWEVYSIALSRNITVAGTVSGAGDFSPGMNNTVNATTNRGYTWLGWYNENTQVSTSTSYTFTMPSNNVDLEARWELNPLFADYTFTSTVTSLTITKYNGTTQNITIPTGTTRIGASAFSGNTVIRTVILPSTVTYLEQYAFSGCTNLRLLVIPSSVTGMADFAINSTSNSMPNLTICVQGVSGKPTGWSTYWNNGGRTVIWNYTPGTVVLLRNNTSAGTVSGGGETVHFGTSVTITVTTNSGFTFIGWFEGSTLISTNATYTFSMPSNNVAYEARWEAT